MILEARLICETFAADCTRERLLSLVDGFQVKFVILFCVEFFVTFEAIERIHHFWIFAFLPFDDFWTKKQKIQA